MMEGVKAALGKQEPQHRDPGKLVTGCLRWGTHNCMQKDATSHLIASLKNGVIRSLCPGNLHLQRSTVPWIVPRRSFPPEQASSAKVT